MIQRELAKALIQFSTQYPVVTVTGPRQSGKTTLVKSIFTNHQYCNLENPEVRLLAEEDPKSFFNQFKKPLIIDEVQRVPDLLSWIQVQADESKRKGEWILTGSHQFKLHEAITQSLAGRTALLKLLPFSIAELSGEGVKLTKEEYMHKGFMPRIYDDNLDPSQAYSSYFQTYIERDVRQLIQINNLTLFEKFIRLLAGRIGQPVNLHSLANDVGVSSATLSGWLSILEASYVIFTLPPYYNNFGKRLIKSPKLYFIETGLAAWLLGIEHLDQVLRDPLHGNLFENMVVVDALKERLHSAREPRLYFWRDNNRNEIDLVFEQQRRLVPIEIKSAMTWSNEFVKSISWFNRTLKSVDPGYVVYAGDIERKTEVYQSLHFSRIKEIMV